MKINWCKWGIHKMQDHWSVTINQPLTSEQQTFVDSVVAEAQNKLDDQNLGTFLEFNYPKPMTITHYVCKDCGEDALTMIIHEDINNANF